MPIAFAVALARQWVATIVGGRLHVRSMGQLELGATEFRQRSDCPQTEPNGNQLVNPFNLAWMNMDEVNSCELLLG